MWYIHCWTFWLLNRKAINAWRILSLNGNENLYQRIATNPPFQNIGQNKSHRDIWKYERNFSLVGKRFQMLRLSQIRSVALLDNLSCKYWMCKISTISSNVILKYITMTLIKIKYWLMVKLTFHQYSVKILSIKRTLQFDFLIHPSTESFSHQWHFLICRGQY